MRTLRIGLAQINTTVGDLEGNRDKISATLREARQRGVEIVAFPELAVSGYPPEDLLFKPRFVDANLRSLDLLVRETSGLIAIIGFVDRADDLYNAAAIACDGKLVDIYHKNFLPNYGVFDEDRYFHAGDKATVYTVREVTFGVNICEDIWYPDGPARLQARDGNADLIVNISSSPFEDGKGDQREEMVAARARDYGAVLAYCNLVGGQDELVFDGGSFVLDPRGEVLVRAARFEEEFLIADLDIESESRKRQSETRSRSEKSADSKEEGFQAALTGSVWASRAFSRKVNRSEETLGRVALFLAPPEKTPLPTRGPIQEPSGSPEERLREIYDALVLGTGDYVRKNGFRKVVVALSGGLDSAIVAVIACDALGKENVVCVSMPSRYSSKGTQADAVEMARGLGLHLITLPIQEIFETYLKGLDKAFEGTDPNTAEENLQARIRGNLVMALCNKFGWIVLTTGNKSEMSMGYATLYGDMAGGFAVIKDIYKTVVYDLAHYRNGRPDGPVIPPSIIERAPTAELREAQLDTDSLPPYPILDPILKAYVEEDQSLSEIVAAGSDEDLVQRVVRSVDLNEYKRRQAPPGVKITSRAFGRDRRLPITNHCREY